MARRPTQADVRRQVDALAADWEPRLRDAFLAAVADVANRAELGRIVERLERGDIAGAIDAVHLDPAVFRQVEDAFTGAFGAGGAATVSGMPTLRSPSGGNVVLRFDVRAPRAEEYLRQHSAGLVTRLVDDQREALRVSLTQGLVDGRNPRSVALDIVGRVSGGRNNRTGGIVGLSAPQARTVENARQGLLLGDPDAMRAYLSLNRRDRRFDRVVAAAIRDGKKLDADTVARIIGRYSDRLLQLRGETIARTETLAALSRSREEAFRQAIDTGAVEANQVTKRWLATKDRRTRDSHAAIDGASASLDGRFANGLLYPHEDGAPASEIVNCRCSVHYVIDFLAGAR